VEIELFADPSCPFTWVVARWLVAATGQTGDHLVVRPLSLGVLNADDDSVPEPYASHQRAAVGALRAMEAVREASGDDVATAFFMESARRFHLDDDTGFDRLADALQAAGAPASALAAVDDSSFDASLTAGLDAAAAALGEPSGSPVVSLPSLGRAFWGPILQAVPGPEDAARMLAAVTTLASIAEFGQMKGTTGDLVVS